MGSIVPPLSTNVALTLKTDYCGNMIYENGQLSKILTDVGYITLANSTPTYHYYLQDHLGNNRVVIDEHGQVEQVNHYYAFGGLMGESTGGGAQPYKYNGKELDRMHGLDWYDYGARHYDAVLGRWMCVDPLAEKYNNVSPFVFCKDNPIGFIDPDGKKVYQGNLLVIYLVNGQLTLSSKANEYTRALYDGMIKTATGKRHLSMMVRSKTNYCCPVKLK